MSTTQQLVSLVKEEHLQGWGTTRILRHLNWAQKKLFKNDCDQHIFYNGSDEAFPWPFLSTTATQLKYNINDSALLNSDGDALPITLHGSSVTCRKISKIFVAVTTVGSGEYERKFYGEAFTPVGFNEYYSRKLSTVRFFEVPVTIRNQVDAETPYLIFNEDPGTHTDRYYAEIYVNPIELTSVNISMSLDSDEWEDALIDGVVGRAEYSKNGRSEKYEKFQRYWQKKYINSMSETDKTRKPVQFAPRNMG